MHEKERKIERKRQRESLTSFRNASPRIAKGRESGSRRAMDVVMDDDGGGIDTVLIIPHIVNARYITLARM